jgi:hypothetical protein
MTAIRSHVPLTIENVTLSDGSEGIEAHSDVQVTTGTISNFTAYGVEVLKGHTTLDGVTITNCGMGIALGGYQQSAGDSTSVSATDCTITSPDFHGVTTSTYDHRHLLLDGTEINDAYYGVSLISGNTADIRDCTFRRNDSGLLFLSDPKGIAVRSSLIDSSTTSGVYCVNGGANYYLGGNTIQANPVGVLCLIASPLIKNGNAITGNTTGIKCDAGSNPVVEWNTISANTTGVWSLNGSNPDLGHATGGSSIGNNTFSGNTTYHVLNQSVSTTLVAENNWWGSSGGPDPGKISGSVDYDPWLTSVPASPPSPAPPAGEDEERELTEQVPDHFDLSPGFPNPFNPSATLRVQVPRPGSRVVVVSITLGERQSAPSLTSFETQGPTCSHGTGGPTPVKPRRPASTSPECGRRALSRPERSFSLNEGGRTTHDEERVLGIDRRVVDLVARRIARRSGSHVPLSRYDRPDDIHPGGLEPRRLLHAHVFGPAGSCPGEVGVYRILHGRVGPGEP